MPLQVTLPSEIEPGTNYTAWAWGPRLRIDAANEAIVVEYEAYASAAAAYAGGKPVAQHTLLLAGKDYRNWVRANPAIFTALMAAVDAAAISVPALAEATAIAGSLPAWASEPAED